MKELTIPHEIADGIALASMQDQLAYLEKELEDHITQGAWLHEDDVKNNHQLIYCLRILIRHYGG